MCISLGGMNGPGSWISNGSPLGPGMTACVQPPVGHLSPGGQTKPGSSTSSWITAVVANVLAARVNFAVRSSLTAFVPEPSMSVSSANLRPFGTAEAAWPSVASTDRSVSETLKSSGVGSEPGLSLLRASEEIRAVVGPAWDSCTSNVNESAVGLGFTEPRSHARTTSSDAAPETSVHVRGPACLRTFAPPGNVMVSVTFVAVDVLLLLTSTPYVAMPPLLTTPLAGERVMSRHSLLPHFEIGNVAPSAEPAAPATAASAATVAIKRRVRRAGEGSILLPSLGPGTWPRGSSPFSATLVVIPEMRQPCSRDEGSVAHMPRLLVPA